MPLIKQPTKKPQFKTPLPLPPSVPPGKNRGHSLLVLLFLGMIVAAASMGVGASFYDQHLLTLKGGLTAIVPTVVPFVPTRVVPTLRPSFERGITTPRWSQNGYSAGDTTWRADLPAIIREINATWVELPVLFQMQRAADEGTLTLGYSEPSLASVESGVRYAHSLGYSVFLVPLVQVAGLPGTNWVGALSFSQVAATQDWFGQYWQLWQPYARMAQQEHVEQLAMATEWSKLAGGAPQSLWTTLIAEVASVYKGHLTYDMNWTEAVGTNTLPGWEHDKRLYALGISEYMPLLSTPGTIDPPLLPAIWQMRVRPLLDHVAVESGKPVLLSEIGYRNTQDTLYQSWQPKSSTHAPVDPVEQAGAVQAALSTVFSDPHVVGCFWWGWRDVDAFSLVGQKETLATLHEWYTR